MKSPQLWGHKSVNVYLYEQSLFKEPIPSLYSLTNAEDIELEEQLLCDEKAKIMMRSVDVILSNYPVLR